MISFTIPAGTYEGRTVSETVVKFDRGLNENIEVRLHASSIGDWPRQEQVADGINTREITVNGTIKVRNESDHLDIEYYLRSLKGATPITVTYPDASTKDLVVNSWDVTYLNSLYSNLRLTMEVVY
jgi:hypothetical protein